MRNGIDSRIVKDLVKRYQSIVSRRTGSELEPVLDTHPYLQGGNVWGFSREIVGHGP